MVNGLAVDGNVFYDSGSPPFAVNETGTSRWASVLDFTETGTVLGGGQPYNGPISTVASRLVAGGAALPPLTIDFAAAGALIFPSLPIQSAQLSLACAGSCAPGSVPAAVLSANFTGPVGQVATVFVDAADAALQWAVSVTADQSAHSSVVVLPGAPLA